MDLTVDDRNYIVRKWFRDELGRAPSPQEQATRADQIRTKGLDLTYAAITDSAEAKAFRARRGW